MRDGADLVVIDELESPHLVRKLELSVAERSSKSTIRAVRFDDVVSPVKRF